MGITIDANQPDKPLSGDSLMRRSVSGRKQQFTKQSTTVSTEFTMAAGTTSNVILVFTGFPEEIADTNLRNEDNLVSWEDSITWFFEDIRVDVNDSDHNIGYLFMTAEERKVSVTKVSNMTQEFFGPDDTPYTATQYYNFANNGSSSHTIYMTAVCKYILFGEGSL